jgi:hypothetical protein
MTRPSTTGQGPTSIVFWGLRRNHHPRSILPRACQNPRNGQCNCAPHQKAPAKGLESSRRRRAHPLLQRLLPCGHQPRQLANSCQYQLHAHRNAHWIKSQGLLFERHGQRSISEGILSAVLGWENLRRGKELPFPVVKNVYKYLGSDFIKHGYKGLRLADPNGAYSMER